MYKAISNTFINLHSKSTGSTVPNTWLKGYSEGVSLFIPVLKWTQFAISLGPQQLHMSQQDV